MLIDNSLFAICFYGKIERGFRLRSSVLFTVFASLIWLTECIAQDATRMTKNDTLELIKKTRGAAKSTAFSGTALFESSGTARRMSNIDQGQVEGKVVRKVVSMAKKHVIDIYSDNVLRQYRPEEKVVIVSNVIRNGFPNLFSGDSAHILEHYSFVKGVDTTHMAGWIFGNPRQKFWTQIFPTSKYRFMNPLRQNRIHIDAIRKVTGFPGHYFVPLVVFTAQCELKTEMPENVFSIWSFLFFKN